MNIFTKKQISDLIIEQVESMDIDEMARARREDWGNEKLPEPMVVDVPGVSSKDPNTGDIVKDKVISDDLRIAPKGQKFLMFYNQELRDPRGYPPQQFYEIDIRRVHKHLPRSDKYGTAYSASFDPDTKEQIKENPETTAKRLTFPIIKKLFEAGPIRSQLLKCAIPKIVSSSHFTEPVTNVEKTFTFGGVGPQIKFNLHTVQDSDDIQTAIDKILNYRMSLDDEGGNQSDTEVSNLKRMVRKYGGNRYSGGEWDPSQHTYSEKHHELTPILKLNKRAVQGGKVSFTVQSDLTVIGGLNGNEYTLALNFSVTKFLREASKSRGIQKGQVIEPIRVHVTQTIPEGVSSETLNVVNNKLFFKSLFDSSLQQLGNKILEINPDDALTQLMFDPSEVDTDFANDN